MIKTRWLTSIVLKWWYSVANISDSELVVTNWQSESFNEEISWCKMFVKWTVAFMWLMKISLRKAIMLWAKLKNRANRSKDTRDIKMYKQQRNLVIRLN